VCQEVLEEYAEHVPRVNTSEATRASRVPLHARLPAIEGGEERGLVRLVSNVPIDLTSVSEGVIVCNTSAGGEEHLLNSICTRQDVS